MGSRDRWSVGPEIGGQSGPEKDGHWGPVGALVTAISSDKHIFPPIQWSGFPQSWKMLEFKTILESHGNVMDFCLFKKSWKTDISRKSHEILHKPSFARHDMTMADF